MAVDIAYARIGATVKGAAAYLRVPVAVAWRHLVAVVKADMGVDLDTRIIQARGGAAASAGTHVDGACVDVRVWGLTAAQRRRIVLLARECGFPASWDRGWEGNEHLHLGADIPGTWTRASYQVAAVKAGYNGLGSGGRGGRDDGPKPSAWRNTTTGPEWARQKLAASGVASPGVPSTGDKPAATTPQEDIMTPEQEKKLDAILANTASAFGALGGREYINEHNKTTGNYVLRFPIGRGTGTTVIQEIADIRTDTIALRGQIAGLTAALKSLADGQGVDLAAVTAAAEKGVRQGLEGATVTIELEG